MGKAARPEWFETFFDGLYGRILGGRAHERRAPREAALVKRALRLRRGQRVLDCPCGLGRISRELARLGLNVTGADLTSAYIRSARRRAARRGLTVRLVQSDMRELPFAGEFHAVVNWFSSFGYFDEGGNLAAAGAAYRALRPGGQYLIELMNKTWIRRNWRPKGDETYGGVRVISRARWDGRTGRVHNVWTFIRGRRRERHGFSMRLYSPAELRALLRRAGFRDVRVLANPKLTAVTGKTPRMIAVARRPK